MKTQTIGKTVYIVKKYERDEDGMLTIKAESWMKSRDAFRACEYWEQKHGENTAFVFKAKQCIEVGD